MLVADRLPLFPALDDLCHGSWRYCKPDSSGKTLATEPTITAWAAQCGPGELPNNSISKHSGLTWLRCRWSMSHSLKFRAETAFPGIIVYKTVFSNILPAETASVRIKQEKFFFLWHKQKIQIIWSIPLLSYIINAFVLALCLSKPKTN